jgi:acyl-coenzyme A synthetase/AMP-(fatty) acid ligase
VHSPYVSPELIVDDDGYFITGDQVKAGGLDRFALKGRADTITKVGGKRVDLEEIRLLIKNEYGVTDCVVRALPEPGGRGHRIGTLIQGETADTAMIQSKLAEALEPYAVPRRIKKVERIPLTQNGKYDWNAIVRLLDK